MAKKIGLEVEVKTGQAEQSVGNIRKELKSANAELIAAQKNFGTYSAEAVKAAKKVAGLKDSIQDAKETADLFDPGQKFSVFSNALNTVAGGFAAAQGAMGLFGAETQDVEKALLKVQSALALSQGLSQIADAGQAFGKLRSVLISFPPIQKAVTVAQKLFNAAMAANPIGLLVAGITAAIAAIAGLITWFGKSSAEARKNAAAVSLSADAQEKYKKALDESRQSLQADSEFTIELAKAQGKSKDEIRKLILAEQDKKIALEESALATQRLKLKQDEYTLSTLRAADADEELIKKQEDNVKNTQEQIKSLTTSVASGYQERLKLNRSFQIEDAKADTDAANKRKEDAKRKADEAKQARKEQIKAQKQLAEDLRLLELSEFERDVANLIKQKLERIKIANGEKKLLLKIEEDYQRQLQVVKKKRATITISGGEIETVDLDKKRQDEANFLLDQANSEQLSFDQRLAKIAEREGMITSITFANEAERTKFEKENADARKKIAEDEANVKTQLLQNSSALLSRVSDLIGSQTAAGKATAVAAATIDTYLAAQKAYQSLVGIPIKGPILAKIAAGAAIAGGLANIKRILSVRVPGKASGGAGAGAVPSAAAPITPSAPIAPRPDTTALDQQSINAVGNAAAGRAFVLSTDIQNDRERIAMLNRRARIN